MKALLVDDSRSSLERLRALLEATSTLTCCCYTDPREALAAARREVFDLLLVDYEMPGMNGVALTRNLRALAAYEQTPIVMITTSASERVRLKALAAGATDFVTKTAHPSEMRARLRNIINLSTALRTLNDRASWLARAVDAATQVLLAREEEMIMRLSLAVEYRDHDTGGHTLRVARYSQIIAETIGLSPAVCRSIYLAAPLHDVGKVAIPDAILLKPGRLDPDEFAVIKNHSVIGEHILGGSSSDLIQLAAEIAGAHHERWDGTGYPNGLSGPMIPLAARIVAVADVFDALTSARPYKEAMSVDEAFAYVERERGRHLDPTCVDAFLAARPRILEAREHNEDSPLPSPVPIGLRHSGLAAAVAERQHGVRVETQQAAPPRFHDPRSGRVARTGSAPEPQAALQSPRAASQKLG
ncbi:HD domain-containing phosphohydrolase [Methylobacterium sp. ID0610]|uniref:HD domain-containing phosphohydrolase n=1 Tax=Methylobacterium carpenticola TaxID=3344827 RepID=UPI0036A778F4